MWYTFTYTKIFPVTVICYSCSSHGRNEPDKKPDEAVGVAQEKANPEPAKSEAATAADSVGREPAASNDSATVEPAKSKAPAAADSVGREPAASSDAATSADDEADPATVARLVAVRNVDNPFFLVV